jgi:hypothetical protein
MIMRRDRTVGCKGRHGQAHSRVLRELVELIGRHRASMRLLLTSSTGASPHAPMHSASLSVNAVGVVSSNSMPSFCFRCSAATWRPCSAHGRLVQMRSLHLPTGLQVVHGVEVATS